MAVASENVVDVKTTEGWAMGARSTEVDEAASMYAKDMSSDYKYLHN